MMNPMMFGPFHGLRVLGTFGGVFLIPAFAIALAVLVLTTSRMERTQAQPSHVDEAIEIVRQRFAHGEIDAAEYNRLVTGLTRPS